MSGRHRASIPASGAPRSAVVGFDPQRDWRISAGEPQGRGRVRDELPPVPRSIPPGPQPAPRPRRGGLRRPPPVLGPRGQAAGGRGQGRLPHPEDPHPRRRGPRPAPQRGGRAPLQPRRVPRAGHGAGGRRPLLQPRRRPRRVPGRAAPRREGRPRPLRAGVLRALEGRRARAAAPGQRDGAGALAAVRPGLRAQPVPGPEVRGLRDRASRPGRLLPEPEHDPGNGGRGRRRTVS